MPGPGTREEAVEPFHLTKWYLDCVGGQAEALIAYWAKLRWRRLSVGYAATLHLAGGVTGERSSLRPGPEPALGDGVLEWSCSSLGIAGVWSGEGCNGISAVLRASPEGAVSWQCVFPMARARMKLGDRLLSGTGYAERLTLTIAPWQLPIEELRWGRAHCGGRSVVWIDWTGAEPFRLVLVDGQRVSGHSVGDDHVSADGTELRLSDPRVVRQGPLIGSAVGSIPGIRRALSKTGLLIDERKWLSTAALVEGGETYRGHAIHEVVIWR